MPAHTAAAQHQSCKHTFATNSAAAGCLACYATRATHRCAAMPCWLCWMGALLLLARLYGTQCPGCTVLCARVCLSCSPTCLVQEVLDGAKARHLKLQPCVRNVLWKESTETYNNAVSLRAAAKRQSRRGWCWHPQPAHGAQAASVTCASVAHSCTRRCACSLCMLPVHAEAQGC